MKSDFVIIGAGPAGLASAYELAKNNVRCIVIEKNNDVAGLSRTIEYKGYRFDIGPHRFFTKNEEVYDLWREIGGKDFIPVKRLTRIYYRNKMFYYPLKPFNALFGLGILDTARAIISYLVAKRSSVNDAVTFEEWVSWQFGSKLFKTFFQTYTEKVWGIPCSQISAEWASQRIKGLNLSETIRNAIFGQRRSRIKSLVDEFHYPVQGAGMIYNAMKDFILSKGSQFIMNTHVLRINRDKQIISSVEVQINGVSQIIEGNHFISSIPITEIIEILEPSAPQLILEYSRKLCYRSHIAVNLILNQEMVFPDNWIYIHSPDVKMARIANYGNFSQAMLGKPKTSVIGIEYFCFAGDEIWNRSDKELIELAIYELEKINLVCPQTVVDKFVHRERNAYPVYYIGYEEYFNSVKEYISQFLNFQTIGRCGMYKYNNMDHSILTGLLAARNIINGSNYDLWKINIEQQYHEEKPGN